MSSGNPKAVAVLLFSQTGPALKHLSEEIDAIAEQLATWCEIVRIPHATLNNVVASLSDPAVCDRIVLVHYAGHADGRGILLEDDSAQLAGEVAHMRGFAGILQPLPNLRLFFVNGCTSREQVLELTQVGVPAIIATNQGIDDQAALSFAVQFYSRLGQDRSIGDAFLIASNAAQAKAGTDARSVYFGKFKDSHPAERNEWPWEIHGPEVERQWKISAPYQRGISPHWDYTKFSLKRESPYLGLQYFSENESNRFFGRNKLVRDLLTVQSASPLLFIVGASGTGKSSVVRAGLIPAWKRKQRERGLSPLAFIFTPEDDPFDQLSRAFPISDRFDSTKVRALREPSRTAFCDAVKALGDDQPWLFFVDHFEQILTRTHDARKRDLFVSAISDLALANLSHIRLVLAMRDDFFPQLRDYPELYPLTDANVHRVVALERKDLEEVIVRPAAEHGVGFEPGLADEILASVFGQPGALPLLQYTLNKLWESEDLTGLLVSKSNYQSLGGVTGSVGQRFKQMYEQIGNDGKNEFRWMMLKLVTYNDVIGDGVVSRLAPKSEFSGLQAALIHKLINDEKLLVSSGTEIPSVQLGHEKIIEAWPEFAEWTRQFREANLLRQRLARAAGEWIPVSRDRRRAAELLWQGSQLQRALEMRKRGDFDQLGGLTSDEHDFLKASHKSSIKLIRRLKQTTVAAVVFGIASAWQYRQAESEKRAALRNLAVNDLSNAAFAVREHRIADAMHWLLRASQHAPANDPTSESALNLLGACSGSLRATMVHDGPIQAVAFSPDSSTLLTGSWDGTAQLWNSRTGTAKCDPLKHDERVVAVAFSPDGKMVLTGSWDCTARLWDAQTGEPIGSPLVHGRPVEVIAFSPDGLMVITGSREANAQLWDAHTGKPRGIPLTHGGQITAVAFSSDSMTVLTGSSDGTAKLWDTSTNKLRCPPLQHRDAITCVAFSSDCQLIATGSKDGTVRLWNPMTGEAWGEPMKHEGAVMAVEFGPFNRIIVTASWDKSVRLWETTHPWIAKHDEAENRLRDRTGHSEIVYSLALDSRRGRLLTAGKDGTARIWSMHGVPRMEGIPMKHGGPVYAVAFSPDGHTVFTGSHDCTARLWDAQTGAPQKGETRGQPLTHDREVLVVAFSPDGKTIITGSEDKTARLWDAETGIPKGGILKHQGKVGAAAFSPDGQTVITGSWDHTAQFWDSETGMARGEPLKHDAPVVSVAFNSSGEIAVTGSFDKTARLWDVKSGKSRGATMKHQDWIYAVAFDPLGQTVLTGSKDGMARLWNAVTGEPKGFPMKHEDAVTAVTFSPDGKTVLTGSQDGTAQLWDAVTGQAKGGRLIHETEVPSVTFEINLKLVLGEGGLERKPIRGINVVAFSHDGATVLTGGLLGTAKIWDTATGRRKGAPLAHTCEVTSAAFAPDDRTVFTVAGDVQLWDVLTGLPRGKPIRIHPTLVGRLDGTETHDVSFSPSGETILVGTFEGEVQQWVVPPSAVKQPERLQLSVEVRTGSRFDENTGQIQVLSQAEFRLRQERLFREFAGPCDGRSWELE